MSSLYRGHELSESQTQSDLVTGENNPSPTGEQIRVEGWGPGIIQSAI
jgi:hypothetical protein